MTPDGGNGLRTLVVGAGVAGLTFAALLARRGRDVVVVERQDSLRDGGYMLGLYPLGGRVLHGLDLHEDYARTSVEMAGYTVGDGHGRTLKSYDLRPVAERFGPVRGVERGALLDVVLQGVAQDRVRFGTTVTALDQFPGGVQVQFSDGASQTYDLVVVADGLHSTTRDLLGADAGPSGVGYRYAETGWGGWVYWVDPELAERDRYLECWGAGHFLGMYPTRDRLGVFLGGPTAQLDRTDPTGFHRRVREQVAAGPAADVVDVGPPADDAFFWDFHDGRAARWRRGRVVLLGDAATGFLPTAGVGASMAMESAAVLDDVLSRTDTDRVPEALERYEKRRRPRVEAAQRSSRSLGRLMFVTSPAAAWFRDRLVRLSSLNQLMRSMTRLMAQPI